MECTVCLGEEEEEGREEKRGWEYHAAIMDQGSRVDARLKLHPQYVTTCLVLTHVAEGLCICPGLLGSDTCRRPGIRLNPPYQWIV